MSPQSAQRYARVGGILILISFAAGLYGEVYVPSTLSATTGSAIHHAVMMRIGFAGYLVEAVCDVTLTFIFYVLLRPVDRNLALLAALFRVAATATFAASELFYLAAMQLSGNSGYLQAFSPMQLQALTRFSFDVYGYGSSAPVFYGVATVILGYLVHRSRFLPRWLGVLWAVGGLGQVANTFSLVLAPAYASFLEYMPLLLASLLLASWLLLRGVNAAKWAELAMSTGLAQPQTDRLR